MATAIRALFIHGVNTDETDMRERGEIERVVRGQLQAVRPDLEVQCDYHLFNDIFVHRYPPCPADYVETVLSGLWGGVASFLGARAFTTEADAGPDSLVKRTAGMAAQWVANDGLRRDTRKELAERIATFAPHLILAHSLGSLIAYDTLSDRAQRGLLRGGIFTVFGSQIANRLLSTEYAGRLAAPPVRASFQLYNSHDMVLTARMPRTARFVVLPTEFPEGNGHSWQRYLTHAETAPMWQAAAAAVTRGEARALLSEAIPPRRPAPRAPRHRALLVGINEYPDPKDRLAGCVNDVFLMSSVLQECGFVAEDIRVVLDKRATARGILERMEWLLDGARRGDQMVFYYSGHGAQMPGYNALERVDHVDETLVPWDFDWSAERAILDDQLCDLYSGLPYDSRFAMILDCCHSGGMSRHGGPRVRGITPPDDIRHRALRWSPQHQMWVARDFAAVSEDKSLTKAYTGESPGELRLGRGLALRRLSEKSYNRERRRAGHRGPYLPLIVEACGEREFSYEYAHGAVSHGAFTYCMAKQLRASTRVPSYRDLVKSVGDEIRTLGYQQHPQILGPREILAAKIPWRPAR